MKLFKKLAQDPNWRNALLSGKRKLSASDRSELEACRGGKIVTAILTALYSKRK